MKKTAPVLVSLALLVAMLNYQNCAPVAFQKVAPALAGDSVNNVNGNGDPGPQPSPPTFTMSPADQVALVGWYSYKQSQKVSFINPGAGFSQCPAVVSSGAHGQANEYCYEPSGANGMVLGNANNQFGALTSYILQPGSQFASVETLDELFSSPADHVSDNACFKEGLFYYALSYLIIPQAQDLKDPNWDVQFSLGSVDDGLQIISNGETVGNIFFGNSNTAFSINKGSGGNLHTLKNGANTLAAIWVDDCQVDRQINGEAIKYKTGTQGYQNLAALPPNVLRGYIYGKSDGLIIANASVVIKDATGTTVVASAFTDSSGFFQVTDLADGSYQVSATSNGLHYSQTVVLDHHQAATAIVDFTRGL